MIKSWNSDTTEPTGGKYDLKEEKKDDYIWSERLTKNKMFTDDQLFEFEEYDKGSKVTGRSRSQSLSYYDYNVNFCNLWNVYKHSGEKFDYEVKKCGFACKDPVKTCAIY